MTFPRPYDPTGTATVLTFGRESLVLLLLDFRIILACHILSWVRVHSHRGTLWGSHCFVSRCCWPFYRRVLFCCYSPHGVLPKLILAFGWCVEKAAVACTILLMLLLLLGKYLWVEDQLIAEGVVYDLLDLSPKWLHHSFPVYETPAVPCMSLLTTGVAILFDFSPSGGCAMISGDLFGVSRLLMMLNILYCALQTFAYLPLSGKTIRWIFAE